MSKDNYLICKKCGKKIPSISTSTVWLDHLCNECFNESLEKREDKCEKCGEKMPVRIHQNCCIEVHNNMWLLCGDCQVKAEKMVEEWINK